MNFVPANFIAGPAIVTFDAQTFSTKNDITVKVARETFKVNSSRHGQIDERLKSYALEISFDPVGEVEALANYFPSGLADIGASICPAVDKPLVIQTLAGQAYTFARAAL